MAYIKYLEIDDQGRIVGISGVAKAKDFRKKWMYGL